MWQNSLVTLGANGGQFNAEFIYSAVFVRSWKLTQNDYVCKILWHIQISRCKDEKTVKLNKRIAEGYTIDAIGSSMVTES